MKSKKQSIQIFADVEFVRRVQLLATQNGVSVSGLGLEIFQKYFEDVDTKEQAARDDLLALRLESAVANSFRKMENRFSNLLYRIAYESSTGASLLYFDLKNNADPATLDQLLADTEANVLRRLKATVPELVKEGFEHVLEIAHDFAATGD